MGIPTYTRWLCRKYPLILKQLIESGNSGSNEETNGELLGKIWHNMGTAYARLFCFEEASSCYDKAFCYNQSPVTGKAYQLSEAARKKEIDFSEERKEKTDGNNPLSYDIVIQRVEEWKKEYEKYSRM